MQRAHYEQGLGRPHQVLVEDATEDGLRMGYTPNYIRVAIPFDQAEGNQVVPVHLEQVDPLGWVSGEVQSSWRHSFASCTPTSTMSFLINLAGHENGNYFFFPFQLLAFMRKEMENK